MKTEIIEAAGTALPAVFGRPTASTQQGLAVSSGVVRTSIAPPQVITLCEPQSIRADAETFEHRLIWDQAARTVSLTASAQTGLHALGTSGEGAVVEITLPRHDATDVKLERNHEIEIETRAVHYLFYKLEVGG